jgi:hypothetical protein
MKCTYFKEIGKLGNVGKPLMIEFLGIVKKLLINGFLGADFMIFRLKVGEILNFESFFH